MKGDDKAQIEAKTQARWKKPAQALYAAALPAGQGGGDAGGPQAVRGDDVVDAEFTEVKDDKKLIDSDRIETDGAERCPLHRYPTPKPAP